MPETPSPATIDDVILGAMKPRYVRPSMPPGEQLQMANRQTLQAARQDLLKRVQSYSSEQLASVLDPARTNPSQFAADQRIPTRSSVFASDGIATIRAFCLILPTHL